MKHFLSKMLLLAVALFLGGNVAWATTYSLTGKGASAWTTISPTVQGQSTTYDVAVNNTDGHLLVWGCETGEQGVCSATTWSGTYYLAVTGLSQWSVVRLTLADASNVSAWSLMSNYAASVSQSTSGAVLTFTITGNNTSMFELSTTTQGVYFTQLEIISWEEVTSTENLASSDYYYTLHSVEGTDLMMAQGIVSGYQENLNTMLYQTAANPYSDKTEVWMIGYDETYKYGVRNLNNPIYYMQSRGEGDTTGPHNIQFNWETAQTTWTAFNFAYDTENSYWTIENNANGYNSSYFICPWEGGQFLNGYAVAGNKTASGEIGHFKIYRMLRTTYDSFNVNSNKAAIVANYGDITSLINGMFDSNAGWTGGSIISHLGRSWRGTDTNPFYETTSGTMSYTLSNMPAGKYKVVAAWRSISGGTMTPSVAGTSGSTYTGVGDTQAATSEINTNGVQMPYSSLGGFTTDTWGHNWQWITATGTLASDGDLVLSFTAAGTEGWNAIDDVHLYCTSLDGTSYTMTLNNITTNQVITNTGNNVVVTCDIITSNPNVILRSSGGGNITTAAGTSMNNLMYKNNNVCYIDKMVLYDGYAFTDYVETSGYFCYNATLYRSIPADTWCTLTIPFWPGTTLTKKYPTAFSDGTLTFSDLTYDKGVWNDEPMLIKSTEAITAISGKREGITKGTGTGITYGDNSVTAGDVTMTGVYTSGTVTQSDASTLYYVLGTDNCLHKVAGATVSISPFRAYFSVTEAAAGARSLISMNFDDETTAISTIATEERNGAPAIYNLSGQRISQPAKGLYIIGGKKVLVK